MDNGIRNNMMAVRTINRLNKNLRTKENAARHLSLGELISSAGDDASAYSIGEKMKVRIRALDQDHNNVQNGAAMLHVAEGGIQRQIDILREIKAKAIDAANDTNTESDRKTIQKEIDQGFQQIEAIADETEYNGIKVLHGIDRTETIKSWKYLPEAALLPNSDDMGVIPDVYDTLDGKTGSFDIFPKYTMPSSDMTSLGLQSANAYTKTNGVKNTQTIDFSKVKSVSQLEGASFQINDYSDPRWLQRFVFTSDPSKNWPAEVIDISGCSTISDVIQRMSSLTLRYNRTVGTTTNTSISFQFTNAGTMYHSSRYDPVGYAQPSILVNDAAPGTGLLSGQVNFSGGIDRSTEHAGQPDAQDQPAVQASFSLDVRQVPDGSGITIHLPGGYNVENSVTYEKDPNVQIKFVDGSSAPSWNASYTCLTVGKDASVKNFYMRVYGKREIPLTLTLQKGELTVQTNLGNYPSSGNNYYVTDGISTNTKQYEALKSLTDVGATIKNNKIGKDDAYVYDLDLSKYTNNTNMTDAEQLISDLAGKAMIFPNKTGGSSDAIDFYDTGAAPKLTSITNLDPRLWNPRYLDLNQLRTAVKNGSTIADAFASMMEAADTEISTTKDASGHATDLVFTVTTSYGIDSNIRVYQPSLSHYDIDYGTWFQNNTAKLAHGVADYLDGKGFRAYCASDASEWFNFAFHNGKAGERPLNLYSGETIRTIDIDVSDVTDASSLVKAIYQQAEPQLKKRNHYMHLAADYDTGVLTLYDDRRYSLFKRDWPELQEEGAKLADGCYYNPLEGYRDVHGKNFIIQHTDKANFNIRLQVPRTTMDEIFGYDASQIRPETFNVLTAEKREMLLGTQAKNGEAGTIGQLDIGLEYLLSAITLVGAQTKRLEYADANIITDQESTTASESTIRDADMAKEMTQYTKANVLAQAAQSMLAQANQQNENMLGLLP